MIFSLIVRVDSVFVNISNIVFTHLRINLLKLISHRISSSRSRSRVSFDRNSRSILVYVRSSVTKLYIIRFFLPQISTVFRRFVLQTPPLSRQNTLLSNIVTDDNVFIRSQLRLFFDLVTREFRVEDKNKTKKKRGKKNLNVRCVETVG